MSAKKKTATASPKKTPRTAKPKAKKVEVEVVAPAPIEQQAIESPAAVESAPIVEVEVVAPVTATTTLEPPAEKAVMASSKKINTMRKKDHPTKGIAALLYEVRFALGAFFALESIGTFFDERERSGLRNLKHFGTEHAKKVVSGQKVDERQLDRTIGLARRVAESLEVRFYAIMADAPKLLDKGLKELERTAPEYLVRDAEKISKLRENLLTVLTKTNATYDETVDAYKALMSYVPSVSEEAEKVVEAERQRRRDERKIADANALIAEFEELDGMDI